MRFLQSLTKKSFVNYTAIGLCLLALPLSGAQAKSGCCSKHGGVNGCNSSTNHQLCHDGTSSPTCACNGSTVAKPATTTQTKTTKTKTTHETPAAASAETTTTTATTATTTVKPPKGCCSKHGGVASCNKSAGFYVCKDKTQSATCSCS